MSVYTGLNCLMGQFSKNMQLEHLTIKANNIIQTVRTMNFTGSLTY